MGLQQRKVLRAGDLTFVADAQGNITFDNGITVPGGVKVGTTVVIDTSGEIDWGRIKNKPDPTITLDGDASGSLTLTDLGGGTLTVTVANDSHTHDLRYYTETEADGRFLRLDGNNTMASPVKFNNSDGYWLATNTDWGVFWNRTESGLGDVNRLEFHGDGIRKAHIDLDNGELYAVMLRFEAAGFIGGPLPAPTGLGGTTQVGGGAGQTNGYGLQFSTTYTYRVVAMNDDGVSLASTELTVTTGASSAYSLPPFQTWSNYYIFNVISWNAVWRATRYRIYRMNGDTLGNYPGYYETTSTSWQDHGVRLGSSGTMLSTITTLPDVATASQLRLGTGASYIPGNLAVQSDISEGGQSLSAKYAAKMDIALFSGDWTINESTNPTFSPTTGREELYGPTHDVSASPGLSILYLASFTGRIWLTSGGPYMVWLRLQTASDAAFTQNVANHVLAFEDKFPVSETRTWCGQKVLQTSATVKYVRVVAACTSTSFRRDIADDGSAAPALIGIRTSL